MLETPARSEELRAILDDVDDAILDRILATGASIDEIAEALSLIDDQGGRAAPSTAHVVQVRAILAQASHDAR